MAHPKKGALMQVMFPMVDKTDFASIESAITASDFNSAATRQFFGINHGGSAAFTSGTFSKATTLVHSGIFAQTIKSTEANYDFLMVRFTHPSCADQIMTFNLVDYDDSDIVSLISDVNSNLLSYLAGMSGMLSDVDSALTSQFTAGHPMNASDMSDLRSAIIAASISMLSDVYSMLSDLQSDFQSRVPKAVATNSQLSDLASDLKSYLAGMSGMLSDVDSQVNITDSRVDDWSFDSALSAARQANSRVLVVQSMVSDMDSALTSQFTAGHPMNASDMSDLRSAITAAAYTGNVSILSDIYSMLSDLQSDFQSRVPKAVATNSQLSDVHSDLRSQIGGITVVLGASDISDIASAVKAVLGGDISNIYSLLSDVQSDFQSRVPKAVATASRLLLAESVISDAHSAAAQANSRALVLQSLISDLDSALTSQFTAGHPLNASDLSDLRSAITAASTSMLSDVYSLLSDLQSDFQSRVPKAVATNSQVSDLASDLKSYLAGVSGMISDLDSALDSQFTAGHPLNASDLSDLRSAITAAGYTGSTSTLSDIYSLLSDLQSDFQSRVPKEVATASRLLLAESVISDAYSAAMQANSRALVLQSSLSDLDSALTSQFTAGHPLNASDMSDLRSAIAMVGGTDYTSTLSDIYSLLSDMQSDFQSRVPKAVATNSQLSDLASDLRSTITAVIGSGTGAISWPVTMDDGTNPLDGVKVWVTTDAAGTDLVASGYTDALGLVTFMLDAGSYYLWKQLSGYTFTNPESITVS